MFSDLFFSLRLMRKYWGHTLLAAVSLGFAIAVNTAIFSYQQALVRHPLLVPELDRVVFAGSAVPASDYGIGGLSAADYLDWKREARAFEHVAASSGAYLLMTGGGEPESVFGSHVSASYFQVLAPRMIVGRGFRPEEDEPGKDGVVVLSEHTWTQRYGADPAVLGTTVRVNGVPRRIVGVIPSDQCYPPHARLLIPISFSQRERENRTARYIEVLARLRPGVSLEEGRAELRALAARAREAYPQTHKDFDAEAAPLAGYVSGPMMPRYMTFIATAAAFLLLLAASSVANLHYAHVTGRSREMAVRAAIGSGRWRLARQILMESVLIGLVGAVAGCLLASWGIDALRPTMPPEVEQFMPGWKRVRVDTAALLYGIAASIAAGLVAGLAAAWLAMRANPAATLKESSGASSSGSRRRLRSALVVVQVSLAVVLLIGAAVMARGLSQITVPRPGMAPEALAVMTVRLPERNYKDPAAARRLQLDLLGRLAALPGVETAAIGSEVPYGGGRMAGPVEIEGQPKPEGDDRTVQWQSVTEGFFAAMRIPLARGRDFTSMDGPDSQRVAIVNETFARRYLAGVDAIGRTVRASGDSWTIVGIAADVLHAPWDRGISPVLYRPVSQQPYRFFNAIVRTRGDTAALSVPMRRALTAIDADQPALGTMRYSKLISDQLSGLEWTAWALRTMGLFALILSVVGVHGVIANSVAERTAEIGLRMALGADARALIWRVTGEGLRLTGLGLTLGLVGAVALVRVVSSLIFGVSPFDVPAFGGSLAVLAVSAALACLGPAWRATRVDPVVAIRGQ